MLSKKTAVHHYCICFIYPCMWLIRDTPLLSNRTNALSVTSVVSASIVIILIIILYPFMVPKIITSHNASYIQQTSYLFYLVLTASIVLIVAGIGIISRRQKNLRSSLDRNRQSSSSFDPKDLRNKRNQDYRKTLKENSCAISLISDDGYTFSFIDQQSILSIINNNLIIENIWQFS